MAKAPQKKSAAGSEGPGLFDQLLGGGTAPRAAEDSGDTPEPPPVPEPEAALSVSALTKRIKDELVGFGKLAVEGELTRITKAASGHVYFQLQDEGASLACIIWKSSVARATSGVRPEEGQKILVHGRLDVYAPRGGYSLVVDRIEPVGIGKQLAELEALKLELRELGWFERARALPAMPRKIGVVTSRDAAALRDFLRTRSLRWPGYPVRIHHTPVQGPGSAVAIAAAIDRLSTSGIDVLVVTRGGGSLEDLWAFNERPVAEAIRRSPVPVVSGVGHETDTTLADLVADHRAHTPTDAAQAVIPDRGQLVERLVRLGGYLDRAMEDQLDVRSARLEALADTRSLASPGWILGDRAERLAALLRRANLAGTRSLEGAERRLATAEGRLERSSPRARLALGAERARALAGRLRRVGTGLLVPSERALELAARSLDSVSPLKVLARGYSTTAQVAGAGPARILTDATQATPGDELETRLAAGRLRSKVTEVLADDLGTHDPDAACE